ncbi:hypothetical protein K505DRAFT_362795 [Melanomma pulvis-pyrius CBS 109.77]|uniref:Uncharacterized protein n=1 Tax=Melanomma pulvis-pyrius CBS 109.77 TaxID=1314802 RepID=A0A6A6X9D7_9PLEO|nr:hypothetical protein K505DRAFT_362795 [Melanomma pulvis-pyrius CBS 109.77]
MAGYGNRKASDTTPEDLTHEHTSTRFGRADAHAYSGGHDTYGSGATGGAGFGNKSAPDPEHAHDNTEFRFGSHQDTQPYSGHEGRHGSGSTGGAGYGNKTGSFGAGNDSGVGKLMEKAGQVLHNKSLEEKGHAKREAQGLGQSEHAEEGVAN